MYPSNPTTRDAHTLVVVVSPASIVLVLLIMELRFCCLKYNMPKFIERSFDDDDDDDDEDTASNTNSSAIDIKWMAEETKHARWMDNGTGRHTYMHR